MFTLEPEIIQMGKVACLRCCNWSQTPTNQIIVQQIWKVYPVFKNRFKRITNPVYVFSCLYVSNKASNLVACRFCCIARRDPANLQILQYVSLGRGTSVSHSKCGNVISIPTECKLHHKHIPNIHLWFCIRIFQWNKMRTVERPANSGFTTYTVVVLALCPR